MVNWLFYGQLNIKQKVIHSGQIQEDTDQCKSVNMGRIQRASTRVKTGCCFHTWEVWLSCETTASLCNWKHGPPAKRAAALPAWFTSLQISRYQPSDPGMGTEKTIIRPENHLPNIPWIFLEDGTSAHPQQRRTITPPRTRSSLARKGEPGWAERMPLQRHQHTLKKIIDGEFLPIAETATHASLFCNLIH